MSGDREGFILTADGRWEWVDVPPCEAVNRIVPGPGGGHRHIRHPYVGVVRGLPVYIDEAVSLPREPLVKCPSCTQMVRPTIPNTLGVCTDCVRTLLRDASQQGRGDMAPSLAEGARRSKAKEIVRAAVRRVRGKR